MLHRGKTLQHLGTAVQPNGTGPSFSGSSQYTLTLFQLRSLRPAHDPARTSSSTKIQELVESDESVVIPWWL
jgi:hypothetical protein